MLPKVPPSAETSRYTMIDSNHSSGINLGNKTLPLFTSPPIIESLHHRLACFFNMLLQSYLSTSYNILASICNLNLNNINQEVASDLFNNNYEKLGIFLKFNPYP